MKTSKLFEFNSSARFFINIITAELWYLSASYAMIHLFVPRSFKISKVVFPFLGFINLPKSLTPDNPIKG